MAASSRRLALAFLVLLFSSATLLLAQTTDEAPIPLEFNQTVNGELSGIGDTITYSFEVPVGEDVVVSYQADGMVLDSYCMNIVTAASDERECYTEGGGGEGAVSPVRLIAATNRPNARQTVEVTLRRPLDGVARYALTVYPVPLQYLTLRQTITVDQERDLPYRVYTLDADPAQPFTIQIEDNDATGDFLWVASEPYQPNFPAISRERLVFLPDVDGAWSDGLGFVQLYYLGGQTFRVLIAASNDYTIHSTALDVQPIDAGQPMTATVSYRQPIQVFRLNTTPGRAGSIQAQLTDGTGANIVAYTTDIPFGDRLVLNEDQPSGTIEHAIARGDLFVKVQIPVQFTRSAASVTLEWQPDN